jgi:hypothetical protein
MPKIVNQYTYTFVGGSTANQWSFNTPMIPKLKDSNYFDVDVCQLAMERDGTAGPYGALFFVANIPGTTSSVVTTCGTIDSRINLGMIANYDTGANPSYLTAPAPVSFRLNTLTPINPFTVTLYRLSSQELANGFFSVLTPPSTLIPIGTTVNAQFIGGIGVTAPGSGSGTNLTVTSMLSPNNNLAIGQTIQMEGFAPVTITALVTGTGGNGTYTVSAAQDTGSQAGISTSIDTTNNCQLIMTWVIKEIQR